MYVRDLPKEGSHLNIGIVFGSWMLTLHRDHAGVTRPHIAARTQEFVIKCAPI